MNTTNIQKRNIKDPCRKEACWIDINKMLIEGMKNDNNKLFWQCIKSQPHKENIKVAPLQTYERKRATSSKEYAEILNRQFQSLFIQDYGNEISKIQGHKYREINNLTINVKGIEHLLEKLIVNNASGLDDLPTYMLKELYIKSNTTTIQPLPNVILPQDCIKANITSIFKMVNNTLAENYLPLTCTCCKEAQIRLGGHLKFVPIHYSSWVR